MTPIKKVLCCLSLALTHGIVCVTIPMSDLVVVASSLIILCACIEIGGGKGEETK